MVKNYTIRAYDVADHDFVYETKKVVYKKYVEECWGEWNEEKQKGFFVDFISAYADSIQIIMMDDKRVGFYHCETLPSGEYEIGNICIVPECQGQGIGTDILNTLIAENKDKDIILQYFKQNPVCKLYSRLGFEFLEEKPFHIKMILRHK